jgi:hypothetical protein
VDRWRDVEVVCAELGLPDAVERHLDGYTLRTLDAWPPTPRRADDAPVMAIRSA